MYVVATAGHVDHGKSTLVRALTGQDPDRLAEEHRRGLSIELGYCWTALDGVGDVAFVDVPGHERFVTTMLAGAGPVPATVLSVAADDPWMPQAAEHAAALDALGVRHGVLAVTRSDLADPEPALRRARVALADTSLAEIPAVPVSAVTGTGLERLRAALTNQLRRLPASDPEADVRLWVDRAFSVAGAGTVVTGTLPAGRLRVGDLLTVTVGDRSTDVRVRGLQSLGREVDEVTGTARVAVRLGSRPDGLARGVALVAPRVWLSTRTADVRVVTGADAAVPAEPVLHVGAAAVSAHSRPLQRGGEPSAAPLLRLALDRALPLRVGDRVLLRDPGSRRVWGGDVLDPAPPPLERRGAARRRAAALARSPGRPDLADELRRRTVASVAELRRLGIIDVESVDAVRAGDWLIARDAARDLHRRLVDLVQQSEQHQPHDRGGVTSTAAARALGLPDAVVALALVEQPLEYADGTIRAARSGAPALPADVAAALARLERHLDGAPFAAPDADTMAALGLNGRTIAVGARAGRLLRLSDTVLLLPGADELALQRLRSLPQPFTTGQAREALDTTRRVALPLLAYLDRTGFTRRLPDDRRTVTDRGRG